MRSLIIWIHWDDDDDFLDDSPVPGVQEMSGIRRSSGW